MNVEDHISWAEVVALNFRKEKNIPIEREEAVSLGMVGLMKAARNYDESKGKFRTFVWVKIRGELKDWVSTSMKRRSLAPMMSLEGFFSEQLPFVDGTERRVVNKDLVEKLLDFPTVRQVQAIKLYYLEEYSVEDIAENFGTTEANIWILMWRGIRKMRKGYDTLIRMSTTFVWR